MICVEGIRGYYNLSHPHLHRIVDLKVIAVQCQQHHWYHHSQTGGKASGIPAMAGDIGRQEPT